MEFCDPFTLPDKLSTYLRRGRVADTRSIHGVALKLGCLLSSTFLSNNLLYAYASTSVNDAHQLFDEIPHPNAVSWSIMNSAYSQQCRIKDVVLMFSRMQHLSVAPNMFVFGSIFTSCTRARDLKTGIQVHCSAAKFGFANHTFVAGTMIDMYARCGELGDSWRAFIETSEKDVVCWTTMVTGLANCMQSDCLDSALRLFKEMISRRIWPVPMTFLSVLKVFDNPSKLRQATYVHGCMVKLGIEADGPLGSACISMYGRCGRVDEAIRVFDRMDNDVVSWTSLLVAHMQNGQYKEAANLFQKMTKEMLNIDSFVVASMVGVYSALGDLSMGRELHGYAVRSDIFSDVSVGNSLITLYGKCRRIIVAERVFQVMKYRDVISWTAMMTCYSQNDHGKQTFLFFRQMLREEQIPCVFSITTAIQACSAITNLLSGEQMHARTVKMGFVANLSVENSLITMYAKCGSIYSAFTIFNSMSEKDLISWNAMITGLSRHGLVKQALGLFDQLQKLDMKPDEFTFIGVLASCSRGGLVAEGWEYFNMMTEVYGLKPGMEHYGCMVDLLGRSNKLREAMEFIATMPFEPDCLVWEAMLAACKVHGDAELAKYAAKKMLEMKPEDVSPYISLSTVNAFMGLWDNKGSERDKMRSRGLQKEPGKSWVDASLCSKAVNEREAERVAVTANVIETVKNSIISW